MARSPRAKKPQPLEHRLLLTATFCLLAGGAVMVYSASSARTLLQGQGDGTAYLVKYVAYGAVGLLAMHVLSRHGLTAARRYTPLFLLVAFVLLVAVLLPGIGLRINGARRWLGAGPLTFQPSEVMKLALVLHTAAVLSARPQARAQPAHGGRADPRGRRRRGAADHGPARPRHRAGHLLHARRDARRRPACRCASSGSSPASARSSCSCSRSSIPSAPRG